MSGDEDEEMSQNGAETSTTWDRATAEEFYKRTKEDVEQKYFTM